MYSRITHRPEDPLYEASRKQHGNDSEDDAPEGYCRATAVTIQIPQREQQFAHRIMIKICRIS